MYFKPIKITTYIPSGIYEGAIIEQSCSSDERYLWIKIEIEGFEEIFNTSLSVNSVLFNNFSQAFKNNDGIVNTEDFVNTMIRFSVTDRTIRGQTYSKINSIEAILE